MENEGIAAATKGHNDEVIGMELETFGVIWREKLHLVSIHGVLAQNQYAIME